VTADGRGLRRGPVPVGVSQNSTVVACWASSTKVTRPAPGDSFQNAPSLGRTGSLPKPAIRGDGAGWVSGGSGAGAGAEAGAGSPWGAAGVTEGLASGVA
jgi:hypothetical protein